MCKEGIRVGRETEVGSTVVAVTSATPVQVFPARPDRLSISVVVIDAPVSGVLTGSTVLIGNGTVQDGFLAVGSNTPSDRTTVEEMGQCVTRPIFVARAGANVSVVVTEVYLNTTINEAGKP